jgi:hypothetical protein
MKVIQSMSTAILGGLAFYAGTIVGGMVAPLLGLSLPPAFRREHRTLGFVLFLLVGGLSLLQAIWYPPVFRIAHGLEILADSFAHAGVVVYLLVQEQRS